MYSAFGSVVGSTLGFRVGGGSSGNRTGFSDLV